MVFIDSFLWSLSLQGDFLVGAGHWPAWELHFFPSIWTVKFGNASFEAPTTTTLQTEKRYVLVCKRRSGVQGLCTTFWIGFFFFPGSTWHHKKLFYLNSPDEPINSDLLGERMVVECVFVLCQSELLGPGLPWSPSDVETLRFQGLWPCSVLFNSGEFPRFGCFF